MTEAKEMLVHTEPTDEELVRVYRFLKAHGGFGRINGWCRKSEARWMKFMRDGHRKAVVFDFGGECVAVLWIDRYFPRLGTACVHYAASSVYLREVLSAADFILKQALRSGMFSGLWATVGRGDARSAKVAVHLGFEPKYLNEDTGEVLYLLS